MIIFVLKIKDFEIGAVDGLSIEREDHVLSAEIVIVGRQAVLGLVGGGHFFSLSDPGISRDYVYLSALGLARPASVLAGIRRHKAGPASRIPEFHSTHPPWTGHDRDVASRDNPIHEESG